MILLAHFGLLQIYQYRRKCCPICADIKTSILYAGVLINYQIPKVHCFKTLMSFSTIKFTI